MVRLAPADPGHQEAESCTRSFGRLGRALSEFHSDHAERRWTARARRISERHSISRIDLGSPLLEQLSLVSGTMVGRNGPLSRNSSQMPALQWPHPSRCGVVWFGEGIDPEVMRLSIEALDCDVFFTIGTSSLVYPAASLVHEAKRRGAFTVEINIEATPASGLLDFALQGPAEEVLERVERIIVMGRQKDTI